LLVRRHALDTLHARNHVPAAMAMIAQGLLRSRRPALIFDIRGLMAEEYEDAGRWRSGGIPSRLTKAAERAAIVRADGIVVLTERLRSRMFGDPPAARVEVIPCCADLEMLSVSDDVRAQTRTELGLDGAKVMIYVGKFSGWYMAPEMAEFFQVARGTMPDLKFLILTQGDRDEIRLELESRGLADAYRITSAPHDDIARYLAAADFGISFIRPTPSKISSSPTKIGEYLGAGLPVVCTAGVGDLDELITPQVGSLVSDHTPDSYAATAEHLRRLLDAPETVGSCRELARRELSLRDVGIPRYRRLYELGPADEPPRRRTSSSATLGS
jgi:glycosyltransferase involved in cell wall biosynthesis